MSKMGDVVRERVDKLREHHARRKQGKYGFLVRPLTLFLGWLILIVGIITIPFPGPGWLTVFIGIGVLSLEQQWPHTLLDFGIHYYETFDDWYNRQPLWVKGILGLLLLIFIWIIFAALFWIFWKLGMLDWTRPWSQKWVDKLPDGFGLE